LTYTDDHLSRYSRAFPYFTQVLKKLLKAAAAESQQRGGEEAAVPSNGQDQVRCRCILGLNINPKGNMNPASLISGTCCLQAPAAAPPMTQQEREFIRVLNHNLERINAYFMEAEEDAVIKLQALQDRMARGENADSLRAAFVDFHGELVLLLHWSLVNYAGVAKILKKHDKLLGTVGRPLHPFLANVLQQPFTSTEGISRLVKETEGRVQSLSTHSTQAVSTDAACKQGAHEADLVK
jgi:hypothetical protein